MKLIKLIKISDKLLLDMYLHSSHDDLISLEKIYDGMCPNLLKHEKDIALEYLCELPRAKATWLPMKLNF